MESSCSLLDWLFCKALQVNERPRRSHIKPWVAVRFFSSFSLVTNCSRVAERAGAASYLARTFCVSWDVKVRRHRRWSCQLTTMLPLMSECTVAKAVEPNRSACCVYSASGSDLNKVNGRVYANNRNTDAPNNPKRPSDASRNAKVSTPASVIGTSAKDLAGSEYKSPTGTMTGAAGLNSQRSYRKRFVLTLTVSR